MFTLGEMRTQTADLGDDAKVIIITKEGRHASMTLGEHREHSKDGKDETEIRLMDQNSGLFCEVRGFRIEDGNVMLTQGDMIESEKVDEADPD